MPTEAEKAAYREKFYAQREADVESDACAYAHSLGCWHKKFKSANNRGVPDRIFITPAGVVFFIEFKRPNKKKVAKAGKLQKLVIDEMNEHNAIVFVTNDLAKAKAIIRDMAAFGEYFG
jgi:hypothetical protein